MAEGCADLLGNGSLLKRVLRAGKGPQATLGDRVKMHYEWRMPGSNEVIDSSYELGAPFHLTVGENEVILAWEKAILSMQCGEKADLVIRPDLAYGQAGCGGGVVPAAEDAGSEAPSLLHCRLELLELNCGGGGTAGVEDGETLSPEEALQRALRAKDSGNNQFRAGELQIAAESYETALQLLGFAPDKGIEDPQQAEAVQEQEEARWSDVARREARDRLMVTCCLNLSQCELKLKRFTQAFQHASAAVSMEPNNSKALYRRGSAALSAGLYDQASADLTRAAKLEPRNAEIRAQLQTCQQRARESEQRDRSTFGGLFGRGSLYGEQQQLAADTAATVPFPLGVEGATDAVLALQGPTPLAAEEEGVRDAGNAQNARDACGAGQPPW
mmetsp:Transcript_21625/g.42252  ORF Transcript_21625/g.42252 Transcript_21625/m.42252 type:complete len:387 (-) Transcript_21625:312-1472(-)